MEKQKEIYLKISNLKCLARNCKDHKRGYSFLPKDHDILPEVYCGNCGGRVEVQFLIETQD